LQPLAREINYSETVFVLPKEADGNVRIRIFTPAAELPFAGHPTLGTAFVLAAPLQLDEIRVEAGAGGAGSSSGGWSSRFRRSLRTPRRRRCWPLSASSTRSSPSSSTTTA